MVKVAVKEMEEVAVFLDVIKMPHDQSWVIHSRICHPPRTATRPGQQPGE